MDAGQLRHRIGIDERVTTQDEHGDEIVTWTSWLENEPAKVAHASGAEFIAGQGLVAQTTTDITIHWRRGIVQTMRIRHLLEDGSPPVVDVYDIVRLLPDKETGRQWLTIKCNKGVNEG